MKKNVPLLETDSTLDRQNFTFSFGLNWLVEQTDLNSDALVHLKLMLLPTWILLPTWMLLPTLDVLTNIGRGYILFKFKIQIVMGKKICSFLYFPIWGTLLLKNAIKEIRGILAALKGKYQEKKNVLVLETTLLETDLSSDALIL